MLYTAYFYELCFPSWANDPQECQTAPQLLASLVRAQHLSQFWLSAAVLCPSAQTQLLSSYDTQLQQLLMLKAGVDNSTLQVSRLQQLIPGAPGSWGLGQRRIREAPTVMVTWELDVAAVRSAAQRNASCQAVMKVGSSMNTNPLGGLAFGITAEMHWDSCRQGSTFAVFVACQNAPRGSYLQFQFELTVAGKLYPGTWTHVLSGDQGSGGHLTEPMAGGWDAAAWACAGLPLAGKLALELKVTKVAHIC